MVHEIGHYLGLYHTFQGGCNDEPSGPGPFSVSDTPPASNSYSGCNSSSCVDNGCGTSTDQAIANFMDYTNDACMTMFSADQALVMNYWANELFAGSASMCSTPSPMELPSACLGQPCTLVCPSMVTTPYSGAEEICTIAGDYTLPTDFSSVVVDETSDVVYIWSIGNYLSAGGAVAAATFTPAPSTCAPEDVTFYLNVDCGTTPLMPTLDAGTLVLTVYPDPASFVVSDLVTFTDGECAVPSWVVSPGCEAFVTVTPTNEPTTVSDGDSGTVNYEVTLDYPVACCCPTVMGTQTETNTTVVAIPDNGGAANPGCSTVTIPTGGSITDITIDLVIDHTYTGDLIITLTSPANTTITLGDGGSCSGNDLDVTFDDAAANTSATFTSDCNSPPSKSGPYQPSDALSIYDGEDAVGVWTICVIDDAGQDAGTITSFGVTVETFDSCADPAGCMLAGTANYDCNSTCPPDFLNGGNGGLIGTESGIADYETNGGIESIQTIGPNAQVDYDSKLEIFLNSGFSTILGAEFHSFIDGCDGAAAQETSESDTNVRGDNGTPKKK